MHSAEYWHQREAGSRAAYSYMAGVANHWIETELHIDGHVISLQTMVKHPEISLAFLHATDGNMGGEGFEDYNDESLAKLWAGNIGQLETVDHNSTYTRDSLVQTLAQLIAMTSPDQIHTQDFVDAFGDGDHSDHHTTAYFANQADAQLPSFIPLTAYRGYPMQYLAPNISGNDLGQKEAAFLIYAQHDGAVCATMNKCDESVYGAYLNRQYPIMTQTSP
jgi:hypothetical protein